MLCALALTSFAIASCDKGTAKGTASDGYTFEQGVEPYKEREISIVLYRDAESLKAFYATLPNARTLSNLEDLKAFSSITDTRCVIHMVDPAVSYDPEFAGHELVHCMYGEFHPNQNNR